MPDPPGPEVRTSILTRAFGFRHLERGGPPPLFFVDGPEKRWRAAALQNGARPPCSTTPTTRNRFGPEYAPSTSKTKPAVILAGPFPGCLVTQTFLSVSQIRPHRQECLCHKTISR